MAFLIAFFSFIGLIILHELGHFVFAKKFGMKVEEFGIGMPPKIWGKQIGETIYSLNLLPLGAFVRIQGEEGDSKDPRSFNAKPMWQRMVVVAAGVIAFWLVSILLFTGLAATSGIPTGIEDSTTQGVSHAAVQIIGIAKNSPAKEAGIKLGDTIQSIKTIGGEVILPTTVKEVQNYSSKKDGQALEFSLSRMGENITVFITPRMNPPQGEGPLGISLVRSALVKQVWYMAPIEGVKQTWGLTLQVVDGLGSLVTSLIHGKGAPEGTEVMGPIGIFQMLMNTLSLGWAYFLSFLAMLSVYLAVFNALPIPVVDGGRFVFLALEFMRKKPLPERIEKSMSTVIFTILIGLMILVTLKDIIRIF